MRCKCEAIRRFLDAAPTGLRGRTVGTMLAALMAAGTVAFFA